MSDQPKKRYMGFWTEAEAEMVGDIVEAVRKRREAAYTPSPSPRYIDHFAHFDAEPSPKPKQSFIDEPAKRCIRDLFFGCQSTDELHDRFKKLMVLVTEVFGDKCAEQVYGGREALMKEKAK